MRLSLHPITPESRLMRKVLEVFANGGVIVYPTDSGYSLGCDALNKAAVNKLYHLKREIKKYYMALMMLDFGLVTEFAKVDTTAFRYMRKLLDERGIAHISQDDFEAGMGGTGTTASFGGVQADD